MKSEDIKRLKTEVEDLHEKAGAKGEGLKTLLDYFGLVDWTVRQVRHQPGTDGADVFFGLQDAVRRNLPVGKSVGVIIDVDYEPMNGVSVPRKIFNTFDPAQGTLPVYPNWNPDSGEGKYQFIMRGAAPTEQAVQEIKRVFSKDPKRKERLLQELEIHETIHDTLHVPLSDPYWRQRTEKLLEQLRKQHNKKAELPDADGDLTALEGHPGEMVGLEQTPEEVKERFASARFERGDPHKEDGSNTGSPTAGDKPPATGEQPPAQGEPPPATGEQPPAQGEPPPATGEQPPAQGEPPATGDQTPTQGELPPATGDQPPAQGDVTGPGDVGIASIASVRSEPLVRISQVRQAAVEEMDDAPARLVEAWRARELAMSARMLELLRGRGQRQTPPPPPYVRGPMLMPFSISLEKLRALDGQKSEVTDASYAGVFAALLSASDGLRDFFAVAVENGYKDDPILLTTLLFGHYLRANDPLAMGDMAWLANPMTQDGGSWGIVLAAQGRTVTEALVRVGWDEPYRLRRGMIGTPTQVWRPGTSAILSDDSAVGRFWGPMLSRLRATISALTPDDFMGAMFKGTRYRVSNVSEMCQVLGSDLLPLDRKLPLYPGCVVISDHSGYVGVLLSDYRIRARLGPYSSMEYVRWEEFAPRYIWYPHP